MPPQISSQKKKLKSFCKFFISCLNLKMVVPIIVLVLLLQLFYCTTAVSDHSHLPASTLFIPSDASSLLAFKLKADFAGKLCFSSNSSVLAFCQWNGVRCSRDRVVRVVFDGMGLSGGFAPETLTRLDRLRVLSLRQNELTGPIPDLSGLGRLKFLFLDHNLFSGVIPPSISGLGRIRVIDLSHNRLAGPVPVEINRLDQLRNFRVECNRLNGSVPPLNITNLEIFNISLNRLTGPVPVTPTLSRFNTSSFFSNRGLCGKIIGKECHSLQPFFPLSKSPPWPEASAALGQNAQSRGGVGIYNLRKKPSKKSVLIIAVSAMGSLALVCSILCFALAARKMGGNQISSAAAAALKTSPESISGTDASDDDDEEKAKKVREGMRAMGKSGNLVFCAGESPAYTLEQLMTASAELLGKGTMATTYKAVLDDRTVVCVKRLDAGKVAGGANKDEFERHMESVGALRHPNLVALRAYFHAKEERILVCDYFRNGNLDSLIHGGTTKALHWTSCLKIAEDIAQALSYIHQAWRLLHGNLKSSNVLLGSDFEACLSDYSLSLLANPFSDEDPDPNSTAYKAPEIRRSNRHRRPTAKSDVYSFGVLLLEILSGKRPSEQPFLPPEGMAEWLRSVREDDGGGGGNGDRTEMILEVGMACRVSSPEQRPDMWQVLKMIQEIKDGVIMEDCHEMDLIKGT